LLHSIEIKKGEGSAKTTEKEKKMTWEQQTEGVSPGFHDFSVSTFLGMSHGLLKLQGDFVMCFSLLVDFWVKSMLLAYD
jgi:uncharacterized YccA/Bax inhibitor family protein